MYYLYVYIRDMYKPYLVDYGILNSKTNMSVDNSFVINNKIFKKNIHKK